jgi:hypothetical protein
LPDFYLPEWGAFAEVKGVSEQWTDEAIDKCRSLCKTTGKDVLLIDSKSFDDGMCALISVGQPEEDGYREWFCDLESSWGKNRIWVECDRGPVEQHRTREWEYAAQRARQWQFSRNGRSLG